MAFYTVRRRWRVCSAQSPGKIFVWGCGTFTLVLLLRRYDIDNVWDSFYGRLHTTPSILCTFHSHWRMDKTIHFERGYTISFLLQRRHQQVRLANTVAHYRYSWLPRSVTHCFILLSSIVRFRQEYRLERKVLSELSIDPDAFPLENDELSDLVSKTASSHSPQGRHNISRVVVLHNNKLETFVTPSDVVEHEEPLSSDFFDNDSFWSGSLTWY